MAAENDFAKCHPIFAHGDQEKVSKWDTPMITSWLMPSLINDGVLVVLAVIRLSVWSLSEVCRTCVLLQSCANHVNCCIILW